MSSKNSIDKAYDILKTYEGKNNRILYLQRLYSLGQCVLGDFDVEYILNNYDFAVYGRKDGKNNKRVWLETPTKI